MRLLIAVLPLKRRKGCRPSYAQEATKIAREKVTMNGPSLPAYYLLASALCGLLLLLPCASTQAILATSYINPYDAGWNSIIAGACEPARHANLTSVIQPAPTRFPLLSSILVTVRAQPLLRLTLLR